MLVSDKAAYAKSNKVLFCNYYFYYSSLEKANPCLFSI